MSEFSIVATDSKKKKKGFNFVLELMCTMNLCSAVLAHFLLKERLQKMGVLGCVSCIVGSVVIVIHAPQEKILNSVQEIWNLATQPGITQYNLLAFLFDQYLYLFISPNCFCFLFELADFLVYVAATISLVLALILHFEPRCGQTNILIYLGICSLMGSLTVLLLFLLFHNNCYNIIITSLFELATIDSVS